MPSAALTVFLFTAILLLPWLGETLFNSKGEPREALVAMSMLKSGNWILPLNFGVDIPYKPPFMAWLIAIFASIFNGGVVNEYISRLPSALAALGMVMACYSWGSKARGERFGVVYAFTVLLSVEVFRAAVACRLDMVLTACMVCAMMMLFTLIEGKCGYKFWRYSLVVALLTCATLTKGPVGALLPCFVAGVYALLRRKRFFPTLFKMLGLVALSLIVPALWYYAAWLRGGDGFLDLMLEENIGRLTGTMSYDSHVKPVWYNFATLALGLMPWTVLLFFALFSYAKWHRTRLNPAALFSLTAAILIVGFYCIPESKRSVYLLPAYPFICYGIAVLIDSQIANKPVRVFTWLMAIICIVVPVAIIVFQFGSQHWLNISPLRWWHYLLLCIPVAASLSWIVERHSPVGHLPVIIWSLYLVYAAALMPSILNSKSDKALIPALEGHTILSTYRPYTLDFYLNDEITAVSNLEDAGQYPPGTIVIVSGAIDTCMYRDKFDYELLTPRSCDYRNAVYCAKLK